MSSGSFDIDQLVGPEGFKQVDAMNTKLDAMVDKCIKVTETAEKMTAAFGKPGTGGGGLKGQIDQVEELAKANEKLATANTDLAKEIAVAKEALRQQNTENRLAAKEALALESSQAKMEAQLDQMRIRYKKMTEAQRENTAEGKKLLAQIEQLSIKVKELDGRQGVYTKHVGDYKNQMKELAAQLQKNIAEYNALSAAQKKAEPGVQLKNNIMQMGHTYRELASGTSTATTGMLTFETVITKTPTALDKAKKGFSGLWTVIRQAANILPGLGISGIFLLAGEAIVSMLPQIGDLYDKIVNGNKEARESAKALADDIGKETGKFEALTRQLKDHTLSKDDQIRAAKELKELYPTALKNYSDEEIAAGKAAGAINKIKDALVAVAMARAAQSDIEKMAGEKYANEKSIDELKAKLILEKENQKALLEQTKSINRNDNYYVLTVERANRSTKAVASLSEEIDDLTVKNSKLDASIDKAASAMNKYGALANKGGITVTGDDLSRGKGGSTSKPKAEKMKAEKDNHDQILKWLEEETEAAAKADWAQLQSSLRAIEELRKQKEWEYQQTLDYIQGQMDAQERMHRHEEEEARKAYEAKMKYLSATNELIQASTSALDDIGAIMHEREMMRLDEKDKALKEYYDNELRYIDESGMSEKEKAKARKKLDAENAAQQKQIERDRITSMRKQAQIQKALDIANLTGSTTIAVMAALGMKPYTPLNIGIAAGVAVKGAIELAKLIATPLPQYYVGRTGGPAELARVSERGQEAKVDKHGNFSLLPNRESVVFLNEGDSVLTAEKTRDILSRASYAHLGAPIFVSNSTDNSELLAKQEEQIDELRGLRHDLRAKNLSATFNNYGNFYQYKEGNRL